MPADARRRIIEDAATAVFGEHGYNGGSIEMIARRSGVSPPVVYDHFSSKRELYLHIVERHYSELRHIWWGHMAAGGEMSRQLPAAIDAWFTYVGAHPDAGRMLFRDSSGYPEIQEHHRAIEHESKAALLPMLIEQSGDAVGALDDADIAMAWETLRAVLQGLALWWYDNPHVPRSKVVRSAVNAIWIGFERVLQGETWESALERPS